MSGEIGVKAIRAILLLALVPFVLLAGSVVRTVEFDRREFVFARADSYDVVFLPGGVSRGEPGEPLLPAVVLHFVIPATATATEVRVVPLDTVDLPGVYRLPPAQMPMPILGSRERGVESREQGMVRTLRLLPEVESREWPEKLADCVHTGTKSEFRLCSFVLYPLSYAPATGRLRLYQRLRVEVGYEEGRVVPFALTPSQVALFGEDVAQLVINPEDVSVFAPPTHFADGAELDYALITPRAQAGWFDSLLAWRAQKGYRAQVFTTEEIAASYPGGRDLQEKIRLFLIDSYRYRGLKWALLAGDHEQIPSRRCRSVATNRTGDIPADVYYADLQWSYDGNRNNIFGEMADTVDLYYDIYVGRVAVDRETEAKAVVNKILRYERNPELDYLQKVLLPYVMLSTFPSYSGKVVSDSIANQTPAGWTDQYLANPNSTTPMRDAINQGYHLCHVASHGEATKFCTQNGTAIWNTTTAAGQTNATRPTVMNSIACLAGNFEVADCLAEAAMHNPNGGTVACMMNSREGWAMPPSMGPSELFCNRFYTVLFGHPITEIGVLHARAKDFYVPLVMYDEVWRWCYWDLNLFGDPNLQVWRGRPDSAELVCSDSVRVGAQTFAVRVMAKGQPVANALVACYKAGEVQTNARTDKTGLAVLRIAPFRPGTMEVRASHSSYFVAERKVEVAEGETRAQLALGGCFVDDGGNNRLDPGESVRVYVTLRNMGNAPAVGVAGRLESNSEFVSVQDSAVSYGDILPQDSARGGGWRVRVSSAAPPAARAGFVLRVASAGDTWNFAFALAVGEDAGPGALVLHHDTGYCKLSVTCVGSVGYELPPGNQVAGQGFCYPHQSPSQLYYASLAVGYGPFYVADRYFGNLAQGRVDTDFALEESLRRGTSGRPDQQYFFCRFRDKAGGLEVTQHSYQSPDTRYDDFVILAYDIRNRSSAALSGIYAGVFADVDVGREPTQNICSTDVARRLVFIRSATSANPSIGVRLLAPTQAANLVAIDNGRWLYPDSCLTDSQKWRFLSGAITQPHAARVYDWSLCVAAGPFRLQPGEQFRLAVAFVGGNSGANLRANADSAQAWYDTRTGAADERQETAQMPQIILWPNPATREVRIRWQIPAPECVRLQLSDIAGRIVADRKVERTTAGKLETNWKLPTELPAGVYLVRVILPDRNFTKKLVLGIGSRE